MQQTFCISFDNYISASCLILAWYDILAAAWVRKSAGQEVAIFRWRLQIADRVRSPFRIDSV